MASQPRIRLAICGGGLGGLSLAVALGKLCNDVHIDVYEAAPLFTQVGAGVSIWKRTWYIMKSLGLDAAMGRMAIEPPVDELKPAFCFRKADQEEDGIDFHRMIIPYGVVNLHRADVLQALSDNLPTSSMFHAHFNRRMVSYTAKDNGVILSFEDGTSAEADVLVGADGIKSPTRATMYTELSERAQGMEQKEHLKSFVQAVWSGNYAYRTLVETEKLLKADPKHPAAVMPKQYCGKNKHVVTYPISQCRFVNIVAYYSIPGGDGRQVEGPVMLDASKEELLEQYKGWDSEITRLLNCAGSVSNWMINHIMDTPTYVDGRVALIGDAAHAMTPHLGAGAGQAIEDSFILANLFASPHVTTSNLASALEIYDAIRRPVGNDFVKRAHATGYLYQFNGLPADINEAQLRAGSAVELEKLVKELYGKWQVNWTPLPDIQVQEAERLLKELKKSPGLNIPKL